jgi:hypothetical protein
MKKIVLTVFILPHEIDDLEKLLVDLNKTSKYVNGSNYEFYISLSTSDYLIDWENSKLTKQFFIDKFYALKSLTNWASKSTFQMRDDIMGCVSHRRFAHLECKDATHFIWLDTDICFDDKVLHYMESSIDMIEENNINQYIISPEIVRYWDSTWDCLVNQNYLNKQLDYCKTNNPFVDSGEVGNVEVEVVSNDIFGQPKTKFGGGWFNCLSKALLDSVPLPEALGHYGVEDTFIMWGIEKLNQKNSNIYQFKLKNYVVCENYAYRDRTYYDSVLSRIDRKEEFKQIAHKAFQSELDKIN